MRDDEYLDLDFKEPAAPFAADRREFLKILGGGVFVFVTVGDAAALQQAGRRGARRGTPSDFNAFLRIGEDGRVSCFTGKIEMGQGVITSLAQMLADELNVPLDAVDMVMGDTDLCPWDMGTFGSRTTRFFGPPLRAAAAEARAVLIELAAERLALPAGELRAVEGAIVHESRKDVRVSYAELTAGKRIERRLEGEAALEPVSEFSVVGRSVPRTDALEKVTGKALYAGDIRLPGMLCAAIVRPPAHGAKLTGVDTSEAEKLEGVVVVREGDLVAVLHEHPDVAQEALKKVKADFDLPAADVDDKTIFDHLLKAAPAGSSVSAGGNLGKGEGLAAALVEETYLNSYVAHAPRRRRARSAFRPTTSASSRPSWAGVSAARRATSRSSRPLCWRKPAAGPCRWPGRGRRSSSTTPSARPRS